MTTEEESVCLYCRHYYDRWSDGTGKCRCANGGITSDDNTCRCFAPDEEPIYDFDDDEDCFS